MQKFFKRQYILILCGLVVITHSGHLLFIQSMANRRFLTIQMMEPGAQFQGIQERMPQVPIAGYVSDQDMSPEYNTGAFLQAQYMLAPTVLDPENIHQINILDFKNPDALKQALIQHKITPLFINPYGKTLGIRK